MFADAVKVTASPWQNEVLLGPMDAVKFCFGVTAVVILLEVPSVKHPASEVVTLQLNASLLLIESFVSKLAGWPVTSFDTS
jgi:hypothetical protein